VLNFCANNYLGLADHPEVIQAAKDALDTHGFGMASVRFICGTQDLHKQLEAKIAEFFGTEDTILYAACFDANGGLFEPLLGEEDAVISDALNHASIIDGIRLCKAKRFRYANCDMADLEAQLQGRRCRWRAHQADHHRRRVLDGRLYRAARSDHRAGEEVQRTGAHRRMPLHRFPRRHRPRFGRSAWRDGQDRHLHRHAGQGTRRRTGRFHHRPQGSDRDAAPAFAPVPVLQLAAAARRRRGIKVFDMLESAGDLRERVQETHALFPRADDEGGFRHQAGRASDRAGDDLRREEGAGMAAGLLEEGIYVTGFFYPVVPQGQARIRTQMSAAHTREHLDRAIAAFTKVGKQLGVIGG
jgi:glycine C-acetyltransferase